MCKVVITGISGTGKSALGRRLAAQTGIALHHMDSLIWRPGWTQASEPWIAAALSRIAQESAWVVEGWIDTYSLPLLHRASLILYLDYPGWLAAYGGSRRWWRHRGCTRPEMPQGCTETLSARYLGTMLFRRERPHIEAMLASAPSERIRRFTSRREVNAWAAAWSPFHQVEAQK